MTRAENAGWAVALAIMVIGTIAFAWYAWQHNRWRNELGWLGYTGARITWATAGHLCADGTRPDARFRSSPFDRERVSGYLCCPDGGPCRVEIVP